MKKEALDQIIDAAAERQYLDQVYSILTNNRPLQLTAATYEHLNAITRTINHERAEAYRRLRDLEIAFTTEFN